MMKGNEKDCICANNGKHTKRCDAYRLSQFLLQAAAIALDQPDSLEEKKCTVCLGNHADGSCRICYHSEHKSLKECKRCGEPETAHEKDFIEEALQEYRKTFVRRKIGHFPFDSSLVFNDVETFLKEKLTEAMKLRNPSETWSNDRHFVEVEEQKALAYDAGRLAMKEEMKSVVENTMDNYDDIWISGYDLLAAIREMK